MKKYLILFTALIAAASVFFLITPSAEAQTQEGAQGIEKANQYFKDRLYSKAVEAYKPFLNSKSGNLKYEAELKTVLSYYYQGKFDTALNQLYSYKLPKDNLWKARYYLIRYNLLKGSPYIPARYQESSEDVTKFTEEQKEEATKETLLKLWDMRKSLADMPAEDSEEYLPSEYPAAYGWTGDSPDVRIPDSAKYTSLFDKLISYMADNKLKSREELYEEAYKIKGKDRATSAELWHIDRVNLIETEGSEGDITKAGWMQYISGMTDNYKELYGVKKYIFKAKETLAKASAAYSAAQTFNKFEMYEDAVKTLDYCISLDLNVITDQCKNFKQEITRPRVSFGEGNKMTAAPNKEYNLKVSTRNLEKFYIHIFKINPSKFKNSEYGRYNLNLSKPSRTLGISVAYDKKYAYYTSNVVLPKETSGFYAITLSQDKEYKQTEHYGWDNPLLMVNFTDVAVAGTAYAKAKNLEAKTSAGNFYNVYSLDPKTGIAKAGVKLEYGASKTAYTDKDGQTVLAQGKNRDLHLFASKNGNYALLNNLYFYKNEQAKYILALNTDMAVYKAGSPIKIQLTAAEFKGAQGYVLTEGKNVKLTVRGPNYNTLAEKNIKLDSMGSATYEYKTDKTAMLGRYEITARLDNAYGSANVNIEAFKTPEFEVKFLKNKDALQFNKPIEAKGSAKYYYGLNTADAKVSYEVIKTSFFPFFWRGSRYYIDDEVVKRGETSTDKNGDFKITFTPETKEELSKALPAKYIISASVTDKAGNTINSQTEYIVSGKEKFFSADSNKNFFRQATQNTLEVKMMNINGELLAGKAAARLYTAKVLENFDDHDCGEDYCADGFKKDKLARIDKVEFTTKGPLHFAVPPLKEGWYMLEFTPEGENEAPEDASFAFMVVNTEKPALSLPGNHPAVAEFKTYYPGEKALILVGSSKTKGNKYIEVYKDQFLVSKHTLTQSGTAIMQLPISKAYQGGVSLRWFSVYDYEMFDGHTDITVPYVNSKLNLELSATEFSFPGANKTVSLSVLDEDKNPVDARALITVYDKSLDYYRPHSLNTLQAYEKGYGYNPFVSSLEGGNYEAPMPMFYSAAAAGLERGVRNATVRSASVKKAALAYDTADAVEESALEEDKIAVAQTRGIDDAAAENGADSLRSDFSPNALWLPNLDVKNGFSEFTFTLPQSIGQWSILAAAFTKNVKTGKTDFSFVTRKDLMISLEAPRFLRTGDEIELQALVSNTTDKPISAEVNLTANYDCSEKAGACRVLEYPAQNVTVAAKSQSMVKWAFKAPQEGADIMFSATAKSAALSDGEIKTVALLPSLQQLTSSRTVALKKGVNKLFLGGVDQNAKIEAVHITVSPSLLMPVLNAMPLLVKANRTSATYAANSYLPLAIFSKLYNDYPQLKEAAAKLPKRESVMPAWSANEELLLNNVAQSPWYLLSKGFNKNQAVIDLFDAKLVEEQKAQAEKDLARFQNGDGGYAWVKGGRSTIFITLNVLESFAQAYRYGVKIDEKAAKKALKYITSKFDSEDSTVGVYMAYVLTSFPKEWDAKAYQLAVKTMQEFEKHPLQTPLAYAYAASVYKRLGNTEKAKLQIDRLFDMSTESDITGIAWTLEDRTWQWFEDGITLHAAALQALNEFDPQDERINGLAKWLIFNEKAEAWGNPQSAAKAVYALMGIMINANALEQTKIFTTEWNGKTTKVTVQPYDINPSALTLSAYGDEITPNVFKASINKAVLTMETPAKDFDDYATITALFTTDTPLASSKDGLIAADKEYYLIKDGKARKIKEGEALAAGDQVEVRLTLKSQSAFDFVVVSDPKPAAFEADELLSGWKYDGQLPRYEELKANVTNFFLQNLPRGAYELKYTIRPTSAGTFTSGAATIQSMYMPEVSAHSAGFKVKVK